MAASNFWVSSDSMGPGLQLTTTLKPADQSVISTTTLAPETALMPALGANQTWNLAYKLYVTTPVAAGFRASFTYPAGATGIIDWDEVDQAGSAGWITLAGLTGLGATGLAFTAGTTNVVMTFTITITTGATAGAVQLQFAQTTSTATNTTVGVGSYVQALRIS